MSMPNLIASPRYGSEHRVLIMYVPYAYVSFVSPHDSLYAESFLVPIGRVSISCKVLKDLGL